MKRLSLSRWPRSEPIARRTFEQWSMAYVALTASDLHRLAPRPRLGRVSSELGNWLTQVDEGRATKLLAAFAGGRWRLRMAKATRMPSRSRAA